MTRQELQTILDRQTEVEFTDTYLLGRRPWIFDADERYVAWRRSVATILNIEPSGVCVVGSAATGFSLSPLKAGRPFRRTSRSTSKASDIDIALIDANLFVMAWDTIVRFDRERRLRVSGDVQDRIRLNMYWGVVSEQTVPRGSDPARMLLTAMSAARRLPPLRGYRVESRIYRRLEDLRAYHINSLRRLRAELTTGKDIR